LIYPPVYIYINDLERSFCHLILLFSSIYICIYVYNLLLIMHLNNVNISTEGNRPNDYLLTNYFGMFEQIELILVENEDFSGVYVSIILSLSSLTTNVRNVKIYPSNISIFLSFSHLHINIIGDKYFRRSLINVRFYSILHSLNT